jgi:hypothetical protein
MRARALFFVFLAGCATSPSSSDEDSADASGGGGYGGPGSSGDGGGGDGAARKDAGLPDEMFDSGPTPNCEPGDTSAFLPHWVAPAAAHQNQCTSQQLSDYKANCITQSGPACTTWTKDAANAACAHCLVSPPAAAAQGPMLVGLNGITTVNIAGCIAHQQNDLTGQGCAGKVQGALQCFQAACDKACLGAPLPDYEKCTLEAQQVACSSIVGQAQTCINGLSAPANTCAPHQTIGEYYDVIAPLFCGP